MKVGKVGVADAMLATQASHRGSNVGVPGRIHAWEQVVFNLQIESARETCGNKAAVTATGFHLTFVPTNLVVVVVVLVVVLVVCRSR